MLIDFKDLLEGDEVIIPSNSNLKYLKVSKLGTKSHRCTYQKGVYRQLDHLYKKENTLESDLSKHNATFYLKDEGGYRDIWLVKRNGKPVWG